MHVPVDLSWGGVGSEAHHNLLGLANDQVVEGLGMVSGDWLELDIQVNSRHVLVGVPLLGGEPVVVDNADERLAIVAGLGLVVQDLGLGHAAVLVRLGLQIPDIAIEPVLSQHPGEGGSGPGSLRDAGHLKKRNCGQIIS